MRVALRANPLLDGGALALGAVVAVSWSFAGQLSHSVLWTGVATSAAVSVPRSALAVAAFLGVGYAIVRRFAPQAGETLTRLECGFLAWVVGLLVTSQIYWLLGWTGLYRPAVLLTLQGAGVLLLATAWIRGFPGRTDQGRLEVSEQGVRLLLLLLIGAVAGAYLVRVLGTRVVHTDALGYHLAFPMWYLRSGHVEVLPTVRSPGIYLGADVLYGAVLAPSDLLRTIPAKLLSWCFGGTAFLGVGLLARRLGASRLWSLVAVLGMLTVPAIIRWGQAKNDLAATGMALAGLWLLAVALDEKQPKWAIWIGLCLGYAGTVKITMLLVAPVVALATARWLGLRAALWFSIGCLGPVIPWATTAWVIQGNPLFPFLGQQPDYLRALWKARNANGLTLGPGSFIQNAIPLLLNSDGRVSGSDSLGIPFLMAAALGLLGCLRRRAALVAYASGGLLLLVLMLIAFEGRLQTRYLILAPAVAFAVASCWLSSWRIAARWHAVVALALASALMVTYARPGFIFRELRRSRMLRASIRNGGAPPGGQLAKHISLARQAEGLLKDGEVLLINDGMIYCVSVPFINAHALHSTVIRYDLLDADALAGRLQAERVGAALIRTGISGFQPQLRDVLERFGTPTARRGPFTVYQIQWPASSETTVQGRH